METHFHLRLAIVILLLVSSIHAASADNATEQRGWERFFKEFKAEGTIAISDRRIGSESELVFGNERANRRYSPASTFKIPHTLFALDAGVIRDESETIPWDGVERSIPAWNHDQNLRSSMRNSVVWVYQKFAREIGEERERGYLKKIQYGNEDPTGKAPFWVEGNLCISAHEQIEFLKRFYTNQLPFSVDHQRIVKELMLMESGTDWILRAKSGWSGSIGWWVGWVERPTGVIYFALNIDTPNRMNDLPKREQITRAILISLGALEQRPTEQDGTGQPATRPESKSDSSSPPPLGGGRG